jgi:hypothetical protein
MLVSVRKILILVGGLGMAGLLIWPWMGPGGKSPRASGGAPQALAPHADCRPCHEQVWQEWSASPHASAWVSDAVQGAFRHFGHDRQCESCHAPQPVFQTGLTQPVALRLADRETGVNCRSCHALPDGRMAARRTLPAAPCQPVETPELATSGHCAGCHTAIHRDWQASPYRAEGQVCQACHLPPVDGRPNGRSHACVGSQDPRVIRSGAQMACQRAGQELVVAVQNHATGHNFPGERHNRILLLQVIERRPDGTITLSEQRTIKAITPFRGESSAEQIRARETFTARFQVVQPPVVADIRLLYKAFPWQADRDALVVHQTLLELGED